MKASSADQFGIRRYVLTESEFDRAAEIIYRSCGIHLEAAKRDLVKARLGRRVRSLGLAGFADYFDLVEADESQEELAEMVDLITTNKTQFFRDSEHFEFLKSHIFPSYTGRAARLRCWSAGCSFGQEPYSLAIAAHESLREADLRDLKILATDICRPALRSAAEGQFGESEFEGLSTDRLKRYFRRLRCGRFQVQPFLRRLIHFALLNLWGEWPMKGPFQVIFCRNVMIYFDRPTRERLIGRFWKLLSPGGVLCLGLSEGLTGLRHEFRYIQPAIYLKD